VPFVLIGRAVAGLQLHDGVLADVAPTLLGFAGLPRWPGMTGESLVGAEVTAGRASGSG
jgi:bisphosphoglycerate-independent phosphoglycerate mutase (AlkP superfamily)